MDGEFSPTSALTEPAFVRNSRAREHTGLVIAVEESEEAKHFTGDVMVVWVGGFWPAWTVSGITCFIRYRSDSYFRAEDHSCLSRHGNQGYIVNVTMSTNSLPRLYSYNERERVYKYRCGGGEMEKTVIICHWF